MRGVIHTLHAIDQSDSCANLFLKTQWTEIYHDPNYLLGLLI